MIKFLIKLAIAALIANAAWRVGSAYAAFYRFRDAIEESARFSGDRSTEALRDRILELAGQYDLPLADDGFDVRRDEVHTFLTGEYTQPIALLPGYEYPWTFRWNLDVLTAALARPPSPPQ
ncbi:MAG: hypothetical protein ACM3SQ_06385 [Betaproteobacteria bacterium]